MLNITLTKLSIVAKFLLIVVAVFLLIPQSAFATDVCRYTFSPEAWKNATPRSVTCVNVRKRDRSGKSPLHWAAFYTSNPKIIAYLIQRGGDVNAPGKRHGLTPLHSAAAFNTNPEIIDLLVKSGADLNARDTKFGWTALHWAAANSPNTEVIEKLIELGADLSAEGNKGDVAWLVAIKENQLANFWVLFKHDWLPFLVGVDLGIDLEGLF